MIEHPEQPATRPAEPRKMAEEPRAVSSVTSLRTFLESKGKAVPPILKEGAGTLGGIQEWQRLGEEVVEGRSLDEGERLLEQLQEQERLLRERLIVGMASTGKVAEALALSRKLAEAHERQALQDLQHIAIRTADRGNPLFSIALLDTEQMKATREARELRDNALSLILPKLAKHDPKQARAIAQTISDVPTREQTLGKMGNNREAASLPSVTRDDGTKAE